jgi:hypothetical protein
MKQLDSIQLVKCLVKNADGATSFRLIEKDSYDLWCFLVTTRHNITIVESTLCMWLTDQEFDRKREIYSRAGTCENANRLLLMMYDDHGNFNHTTRYCMGRDSQSLEGILLRHMPEEVRSKSQYSIDVEIGVIINSGPLNRLSLTDYADLETPAC